MARTRTTTRMTTRRKTTRTRSVFKVSVKKNKILHNPLHLAAKHGRVEKVRSLLMQSAESDVNAVDSKKNTPLHYAAEFGRKDVVDLLLSNNSSVDSKNADGLTPLHLASGNGHADIVEALIRYGAAVDVCNNVKMTPLHLASMEGHTEIVEALIRCHAAVNKCDKVKMTPLHLASENGHTECVKALIRYDATVNERNNVKMTPLHLASEKGHTKIVEALIRYGAAVNECDKVKMTPLHLASMEGHTEIVKALIRYSATVNECNNFKMTPLHLASMKGHSKIVEALIRYGAAVNVCNNLKKTPLHLASENGHTEIVKSLIRCHAAVNKCDKVKMTPLHLASEKGHTEIVKALIRYGATVNECNNVKLTPLHLAAQNGHTSTVEILLDNHATIDVVKQSKETPFDLAATNGHADVVDALLRRHVSDFIIPTDYESTPLHVAVENGHTEVVKVILEHIRRTFDKLSKGKRTKNARNLVEIKDIEQVELRKVDGRCVSAAIVWAEINTPLQLFKDPDSCDALELAVRSCQPKMVEILFDTDHCLFSEKYLGNVFNCLIFAIKEYGAEKKSRGRNIDKVVELTYRNFKGIAEVLVKSDRFNVNCQLTHLSTPLHRVLEICDHNFNDRPIKRSRERLLKIQIIDDIIKLLLEKGADINMKNAFGQTALITASGRGCLHAIQILLEWEQKSGMKLDLDSRDQRGATALIRSAEWDHVEVLKLLLSNKASVNLHNYVGFTALHATVLEPNRTWDELNFLFKGLSQKKFEINDFLEDRLTKSVEKELERLEEKLGYNKETTGIKEEMVDFLLDIYETKLNAIDFRGNTPLDLAMESTLRINSATINKLQNRGAFQLKSESNARIDENFRSPLHGIILSHLSNCASEDMKAAKRELGDERFDLMLCGLLHGSAKLGQKTTALDSKGRTPLHYAIKTPLIDSDEDNDLLNFLLQLGFGVNATDIYGKTTLHYAENDYDYKFLVDWGADENIKDNYGYTPRQLKQLKDSVRNEQVSARNCPTGKSRLYSSSELKPNHVTELTKLNVPVAIKISAQSPRCPESAEEALWKLWRDNDLFVLNRRAKQLKQPLQRFMERLAGSIKEKDSRFECQPNLIGSAEEETKVDVSADFDYNMKLTKFSQLCDVFPHPLGPEGYFQLKRKSKDATKSLNDEDFDCFFNSDRCLRACEVNSRFQNILEEVLSDHNFWKDERLFEWIIACIDKKHSSRRFRLFRPVLLRMIHPTDDGFYSFAISTDIAACVYVKDWWPGDKVAVSISPALKADGCTLVFNQPKFDPSKKRLDYIDDCFPFCETFARVSFAPVESQIIKESSPLIKAAYMVCKMMHKYVFDNTYQLKTCLLFCIEALTASNGSETRNEEDITPKELAFWVERIMFCLTEFCRHDVYPCYLMPSFRQRVEEHIRDLASKAIAPSYNEIPFEYSPAYEIYLDVCPEDTAIDIPIFLRQHGYIEECLDTIRDPLWKQFVKEEFLKKLSSRSSI